MKTHFLVVSTLLLVTTGLVAAQDHARPKTILEWRSELVRSLAFTSDGKQLVVSPKDNDVWVFNAENGEKLPKDIKGLRGPTNLLAPGPRPDTVYCIEKLVNRLVNVKTGEEVAMHAVVVDQRATTGLSAKKDVLVLGDPAGHVVFLKPDLGTWGGGTGIDEPPPSTAAHWPATAVALSADGGFCASARANGRMYLWKVKDWKEDGEQAISAHAGKIEALAFTPSGLLSLGLDGKLKRWSTPDAKELAAYSFPSPLDRGWLLANGQIAAVVFKPVDGELKFFQVPAKEGDELKLVATIPIVSLFDGFPTVHREFSVPQIALSPDGQRLALAAMSGSNELAITRIAIYDLSGFMPKLTVASASESDPRVTGAGATKPSVTKTTPMPKPEREFREWSTADGLFKVEAQFQGMIGDTIRLKRKDSGKVIAVPLEKFSEADQQYVKGLR